MVQNNHQFSMEEAKRLARTEAGKKLITLLQSQNSPQLQSAMHEAQSGDYTQLKKALGVFMSSPEAQSLLKQLENSHE